MRTFLALILLSFSFKIFAMGSRLPRTYYVALGDSMTAGFLANTNSSQRWHGEDTVLRSSSADTVESENAEPPPPYMWKDWRYATLMESKRDYSWATGKKSNSVADRLQQWLYAHSNPKNPIDLNALNMAESGIRAEHLPRQARLAVKRLKQSNAYSLSLVTIVFGGNDVCESAEPRPEDEQNIRVNFRQALLNLAEAKDFLEDPHPIRVFVSGIPNIPLLARDEIKNHRSIFNMTCQEVRDKVYNACRKLTNWTTPEEFDHRVARVEFINSAIKSAAEEMDKDPRFEVVFDDSLTRTTLTGPMLGIDCFHAGKTGQRGLAEMFWSALPWFK